MTELIKERLDTFTCIYERRSTRTFEEGAELPEDAMGKILDAARYAPRTADGDFPWRFIVVRDKDTRELYANCAVEVAKVVFGGSFETFDRHIWYMPEDTRMRVAEYTTTGELWRYPETAGAITVPLLTKGGRGRAYSALLQEDHLLAPYLGMAVQNMWLVASLYGIGAGYNAMANLDGRRREVVAAYLGIPRMWEPSGAYSFGITPATRASGPTRTALDAVTYSEYWGNKYERLAYRGEGQDIKIPSVSIIDTIKNLNLVSSFKSGKVDDWMIERIIDTAMWSPSPENLKHWRFLVVRSGESKEFLYHLIDENKGTAWYWLYHEANLARYWYVKEEERLARLDRDLERGPGAWVREADTLIIICAGMGWIDSGSHPLAAARNPFMKEATGCGIQNMMLAATALGLGTNFETTVPHECATEQLAMERFGIPHTWQILGIVGIGQAGEKEEQPPLQPSEELFYDEYYGIPFHNKYSL